MYHTVVLTDDEMQVLKKIVSKVDSTIIVAPTKTPIKKTKTELGLNALNEYLANKKRKN